MTLVGGMMVHALVLVLGLVGGMDAEELARRIPISWTAESATGRHTLRAQGLTVVVVPGMDRALVNGVLTPLSAPAAVEGGRLKLPSSLVSLIESHVPPGTKPPLVTPDVPPEVRPSGKKLPASCKIVIDAGHGGAHTGAKGRGGLVEKDVNLEVALELRKILASWGATVIMTRTEDRHLSSEVGQDLDKRVGIVNRARPDIFMSIHSNYAADRDVRGFEVWIPKHAKGARESDSREMAALVRSALGGVWNSEDRGTKDYQNLRVLNGTSCPAVLVELEFVSNAPAERQLATGAIRRRLAEALADAAFTWFSRRN